MIESTGPEIEAALSGKTLVDVKRKGKQLWLTMSALSSKGRKKLHPSAAVLFHLGMTGSFVFRGRPRLQYAQGKETKEAVGWPPKFTKLELEFSNGECVAFCDPRRLGRIKIRSDPLQVEPISKLAPDPIIDGLSRSQVEAAIMKSGAPVKALLLDQEKVCCGIGNWVADEVLYQSNIHPSTKSNVLSPQDISNLTTAINSVLATAVSLRADKNLFPKNWIFHKRWVNNRGNLKELGIND